MLGGSHEDALLTLLRPKDIAFARHDDHAHLAHAAPQPAVGRVVGAANVVDAHASALVQVAAHLREVGPLGLLRLPLAHRHERVVRHGAARNLEPECRAEADGAFALRLGLHVAVVRRGHVGADDGIALAA